MASHIVPWRVDKRNRVNPRNGLLLSALHDKAFDIGLITIDDDMTVRVSRKHLVLNDRFFSTSIEDYDGHPIRPPEKFGPAVGNSLPIIESMSFNNDKHRNARPPHSYS